MSANTSVPTVPTPQAAPNNLNNQATAGSRESSEFEFVGNGNGSGQGNPPNPPTTLPTDDTIQCQPSNTSSFVNPSACDDVSDKSDNQPTDDDSTPGLFGWVTGTGGGLLSKVAEKTKSSMETVITTLDPQVSLYYQNYYISRVNKSILCSSHFISNHFSRICI